MIMKYLKQQHCRHMRVAKEELEIRYSMDIHTSKCTWFSFKNQLWVICSQVEAVIYCYDCSYHGYTSVNHVQENSTRKFNNGYVDMGALGRIMPWE